MEPMGDLCVCTYEHANKKVGGAGWGGLGGGAAVCGKQMQF